MPNKMVRERHIKALIGRGIKNSLGDGLIHRISDAYSVVGAIRVGEACASGAGRYQYLGSVPVTDEPVNCFACLSRVKQEDPPTDEPGNEWLPCVCDEIDPSDKPCVVCETKRERKWKEST